MCSLDIHEWSFRYTQTHFSVIYQSSQEAPISVHLASSSSAQWAVVVCPSIVRIFAQDWFHILRGSANVIPR